MLRLSVGIFLVFYAISQLSGLTRLAIGAWGGRPSDAAVGVGGGILGGFAGLSGPLPLIWLQLRGGPSAEQRAVYQPFNLIVLAIAGAGMRTEEYTSELQSLMRISYAVFCLKKKKTKRQEIQI